MLIYFVRHGQTDYNVERRIQGSLDTPLNEQGMLEAELVANAMKDIPFVEAWSSNLQRASVTADVMAAKHPGLKVSRHPLLQERSLGSLEGRVWSPGYGIPDDAETTADFRDRVLSWLNTFLAAHESTQSSANADEPKILCVSHGAYLSTLLRVLLSPDVGFAAGPEVDKSKHCLNTSIMRVRAVYDPQAKKWNGEVLSWGEVPHLDGVDSGIPVADDVRDSFRQAMAKA